ncbi:hypothetical protein NC652_032102 [Populus alba x Populus x berolinensis]|nr:hypothetical protein NC652_032102 [Populus alba x Populus x berolinensis]
MPPPISDTIRYTPSVPSPYSRIRNSQRLRFLYPLLHPHPPSNNQISLPSHLQHAVSLDSSTQSTNSPGSIKTHFTYSNYQFTVAPSSSLPSLFGGVRSNAKPGAALAAAAAASRSVPTPHAAAIKSRRLSSGSGTFQTILDIAESGSSGGGDQEIVSNSSNGDSIERFQSQSEEKMGGLFQSATAENAIPNTEEDLKISRESEGEPVFRIEGKYGLVMIVVKICCIILVRPRILMLT